MDTGAETERWILHAARMSEAAIVVHAADTSILWANDKAAEMLGIARDELTGKIAADPSFRLLDEEGRPLPLERYPVMRALREQERIENMVVGTERAGDAHHVWGRLTAEPVQEEGDLVAVVVTFVDDTELQQARRELAASRARFQRAVAGTHDGLFDVDLTTGTAWFAPRFEALLGLECGALEGRTDVWDTLVHPDDQDRVVQAWDRHLRGEGPYDLRYRLRHAEGGYRHFHARGEAIRDAHGRPLRMAGAITDVTEQIRAEQSHREVQARLESAARLESLAVLSGGVAHDFNNLLTAVLGAADSLLEGGGHTPESLDNIDIILRSAERAADLTRQLMAYAGRAPRVLEVLDPAPLVAELARLVRGALPSSAVLEVDLHPETPGVEADATQLRQVVLNLLINASQAVQPGGSVRASTRSAHHSSASLSGMVSSFGEPGDYVIIEVSDDGAGMDQDTLLRIFEPFFTTKQTGHGLGLAAVLGMIRAHKGYVDVHSAPGEGTRFELGLPAATLTAGALAGTPDPTEASRLAEGCEILVVDDEPAVRQVLDHMLRAIGARVHEAADGRQLGRLVRELDPHLIVLDLTLPGPSGLELIEGLRRSGDTRPVLLSSGHVDASERIRLKDMPRTRFLAKPYRADELYGHIAALLKD